VREGDALNGLALFAGVAGLERGLDLVLGRAYQTVCYVERDAYAAADLVARMEDEVLDPAPEWDDVSTFDPIPWRGIVDLVAGGFPCTDISDAGKRAGIGGAKSGLWKQYARIIAALRPAIVWAENVGALVRRGLDVVLEDLAALGYDAEWMCLRASDVGAPHGRKRLFLLAIRQDLLDDTMRDGGGPGRAEVRSGRHAAQEPGLELGHAERAERREDDDAGGGGSEGRDREGEAPGAPGNGGKVLADALRISGGERPGRERILEGDEEACPIIAQLRELGIAVEPCPDNGADPDGEDRWHTDGYCSNLAGLRGLLDEALADTEGFGERAEDAPAAAVPRQGTRGEPLFGSRELADANSAGLRELGQSPREVGRGRRPDEGGEVARGDVAHGPGGEEVVDPSLGGLGVVREASRKQGRRLVDGADPELADAGDEPSGTEPELEHSERTDEPGAGGAGELADSHIVGQNRDERGRPEVEPAERRAGLADTERPGHEGDGHPEPSRRRKPIALRGDWAEVPPFPPGPGERDRWEALLSHSPQLAPAIKPRLRVVLDGLAMVVDKGRTDQLRCAGNGVVPLQAAVAFAILAGRFGFLPEVRVGPKGPFLVAAEGAPG